MVAIAAADAADTTILAGADKPNDQVPTHSRLIHYHHLSRICMPLMEWTCVAAIPTVLCVQIAGLPLTTMVQLQSKLLPIEGVLHIATANKFRDIESDCLMQWILLLLAVTPFISCNAILFFGDTRCCDYDNDHTKSRGMGIVMGSHLIPLLYLAINLFVQCENNIESDGTLREYRDVIQSKYYESCSVEERACQTKIPIAGRGLTHLTFASLGGLSFVISYILSQCNHRKRKCTRQNSLIGVHATSHDGVKKGKDAQPRYSTSAMSICWKIYLLLIILQSAMCFYAVSSGCDVCIPLLGTIHLLLILVYDQRTAILSQDDQPPQGIWQDAFSPGEWMAVSTLITSLVGEYILQYSGITSNSKTEVFAFYKSLPLYLIVVHAGLIGCLIGVTVWTNLEKFLPISALHQFADDSLDITKLGMIVSLVTVAGITFGCIEHALSFRLDRDEAFSVDLNLPTILRGSSIPRSVPWLFNFLSSKLTMHGSGTGVLRASVLGYWACILALCLPLASKLPSWITDGGNCNMEGDTIIIDGTKDDHIYKRNEKERKKRVVIARKYFHLIAILLFAPITWLDADMMALSYAIAAALLMVLEIVRGWMIMIDNNAKASVVGRNTDGTSWNQFYMAFLDEKDSSAAKGGLAVTHIALVMGCAFPLWANQLLQQSYNTLRISDVSSQTFSGNFSHPEEILMQLLPFLGVLVLGVGDSAGAICGMKFGRHRWPGSSRTLEGSLCMFLTMISVVFVHSVFTGSTTDSSVDDALNCVLRASLPLGMITLIEASTTQIDNLCLPIAGSTLVLVYWPFICSNLS